MMQNISPATDALTPRMLPAWVFSLFVHFWLIVLLGLAVQSGPQGAAEEPGRSAGIVLKRTSAEGDLYEGEEDAIDAPAAEQSPTTDILAALPNEVVSADFGDEKPNEPTPGAGQPVGSGQPNAAQFIQGGGGRRGLPGGRGEARVSVFGVEGTGTKFVYLFDRSSSMDGAPLAAAKRQLLESLA
jgi:hypothetical protein